MTYLVHYGVKGMKWGIRRYQNKDGTLTKAGKERYSESGDGLAKSKDRVSKLMNKSVSSIKGFAGEGELEALAVEGVTIAAIIGFVALKNYIMKKNIINKKMKELEKRKNEREIKSISDAPKLKSKESPEESMKNTNPGYPSPGRTDNCIFCTTAMAMRAKGYDVISDTSETGWPSNELFTKAFNAPSVKMNRKQTATGMITTLSSIGPNAYGNLTVYWTMGGGHSVFWKNVNGKTHIYDGQSGKEYDISDPKSSTFLKSINLFEVSYNRLDDKEPTEYALACLKKRR